MSTSWVSHISLILCPPFQAGPEAARPSSDSFPRFQIYVRIPASEKRSRGEGYSGLAGTQQLRYNRQYLRAPGHGFQETACNENEPDSQHHPWHLSRDSSRRRELQERTGLQKKILRFSIHEKPEYFQLSCVDKKDAVSMKRQEPAFCPASFLFPLTLEVFLWGHVSTWNPGDGDGWIFGTVAYTPRT